MRVSRKIKLSFAQNRFLERNGGSHRRVRIKNLGRECGDLLCFDKLHNRIVTKSIAVFKF